MAFKDVLKSNQPSILKEALYTLLNAVTDHAITLLAEEFASHPNQHAFLAEFETLDPAVPPRRNPVFLEKLAHYCWIRLELAYLANQKASLNQFASMQSERTAAFNHLFLKQNANPAIHEIVEPEDMRYLEALPDTVDLAIQEDALRGISIKDSIATLRRVKLQIIGTEHPTDPRSQAATNDIAAIANIMASDEPNDVAIKNLLANLQKIDATPPVKRTVEEEVSRNIKMTLGKLYDDLPILTQAILTAYQTYYGEALFRAHEEEIWRALEGGLQPDQSITTPIALDGSWAAFDTDGNKETIPEKVRYAFRLHRVAAAEKHSATLEMHPIKLCKEKELDLRDDITRLNKQFFKTLIYATDDKKTLVSINEFQNQSSFYLTNKNFQTLADYYQEQIEFVEQLKITESTKIALLKILEEQKKIAKQCVQLTMFSGGYRFNKKPIQEGALQKFQKIFENYKTAIRLDTNAIQIQDEFGKSHDATQTVCDYYRNIMQTHQSILNEFPEINKQMHLFGVQLHAYRMHFGTAHIRQDSSVYTEMWHTIFENLKENETFRQSPIFLLFQGRSYQSLKQHERFALHEQLQANKLADDSVLKMIYENYLAKVYKKSDKKTYQLIQQELERLELALDNNDMVENIIISNSESAANIEEVKSLQLLLTEYKPLIHRKSTILIVPLLEKRQDLENFESILIPHIKSRIQEKLEAIFNAKTSEDNETIRSLLNIRSIDDIQRWVKPHQGEDFSTRIKKLESEIHRLEDAALKADKLQALARLWRQLKTIKVKMMVGYSDTERLSGLPAKISIQQVQEDFIKLAHRFGVDPEIFHGPGGDPNRGGLREIHEEITLQGNAREELNTPASTNHLRQIQFYQAYRNASDPARRMEFHNKPEYIQTLLTRYKAIGSNAYETLHDKENGLGKIFGLVRGRGPRWLIDIGNVSSRASERGKTDDHTDRTVALQTGGAHPKLTSVDLDNLRAITAAQNHEVLRDYTNLIMGSGCGLRELGLEAAIRLYNASATIRDIVIKINLGLAMADYSITQHALFSAYPNLCPANDAERKAWAKECKTTYPGRLKAIKDIDAELATTEGKEAILMMMSRFFAYLYEEYLQTKEFIANLNQAVHQTALSASDTHASLTKPTDILEHYPDWQEQTEETVNAVKLLSLLTARMTAHIEQNRKLDQVYMGLNEHTYEDSEVTPIGRLIANIIAGINSSRKMQPHLTKRIHLNYADDLRNGETRAGAEIHALEPSAPITNIKTQRKSQPTQIRLFDQRDIKSIGVDIRNTTAVVTHVNGRRTKLGMT